MMEYRISSRGHATEIHLLGPEFEGLESLLDRRTTSYCVPIPYPSTCVWCNTLVAAIHFPSGRWIDAEVFADQDSSLRADLLQEHHCAESERFAEFLSAPVEPEGDGETE
jgi:hypothetical protein